MHSCDASAALPLPFLGSPVTLSQCRELWPGTSYTRIDFRLSLASAHFKIRGMRSHSSPPSSPQRSPTLTSISSLMLCVPHVFTLATVKIVLQNIAKHCIASTRSRTSKCGVVVSKPSERQTQSDYRAFCRLAWLQTKIFKSSFTLNDRMFRRFERK